MPQPIVHCNASNNTSDGVQRQPKAQRNLRFPRLWSIRCPSSGRFFLSACRKTPPQRYDGPPTVFIVRRTGTSVRVPAYVLIESRAPCSNNLYAKLLANGRTIWTSLLARFGLDE